MNLRVLLLCPQADIDDLEHVAEMYADAAEEDDDDELEELVGVVCMQTLRNGCTDV